MSGAHRSRIMDQVQTSGNLAASSMYADMVLQSAYDPDLGVLLFEESDRDALMGKSAAALDRIAEVAMRLSGMDKEAVDEAKRQFPEASA